MKDKSGVVKQPKRGRNVVAGAETGTEPGMRPFLHRRRSNAGRDKEPGTGHCPHNRGANVYNNLVIYSQQRRLAAERRGRNVCTDSLIANSAGWQLTLLRRGRNVCSDFLIPSTHALPVPSIYQPHAQALR